MGMETNKERFIKIFSNLQIDLRNEIILIINEKPITWNVAYNEIINESNLSKVILKKMAELELI